MEQLLETGKIKTDCVSQTYNQNEIQKLQFLANKPQYASLLSKVFIFSVILLYLTKYFYKNEIFLEYTITNMKV